MTIAIKDWNKFQHFKDRRPPWVKLYRDLLDDLEWHELSPTAAKALVSIWLIASEFDGNLPDTKKLAFRLRMSEKQTESIVSELSHWLVQDDIKPISTGYQDDPLETETEKRERQRKETEGSGAAQNAEPPALRLPLVDGTDFDVMQPKLDEWSCAYPAVNVHQSLLGMRQWCIANPENRKTRRGIERFVIRWLSKEQDKGGIPRQSASETPYQRSMRERVAEFSPGIAKRAPLPADQQNVIDMELPDVLALSRH